MHKALKYSSKHFLLLSLYSKTSKKSHILVKSGVSDRNPIWVKLTVKWCCRHVTQFSKSHRVMLQVISALFHTNLKTNEGTKGQTDNKNIPTKKYGWWHHHTCIPNGIPARHLKVPDSLQDIILKIQNKSLFVCLPLLYYSLATYHFHDNNVNNVDLDHKLWLQQQHL